jgi:hypothetical protein
MKNIEEKIADFDWQTVTGELNEKHMPWCQDSYLVSLAMNLLANTITQIYIARPVQWKRHRFGLGEYKQVTITEIIWQNGKALEILRIEIKSAEQ